MNETGSGGRYTHPEPAIYISRGDSKALRAASDYEQNRDEVEAMIAASEAAATGPHEHHRLVVVDEGGGLFDVTKQTTAPQWHPSSSYAMSREDWDALRREGFTDAQVANIATGIAQLTPEQARQMANALGSRSGRYISRDELKPVRYTNRAARRAAARRK